MIKKHQRVAFLALIMTCIFLATALVVKSTNVEIDKEAATVQNVTSKEEILEGKNILERRKEILRLKEEVLAIEELVEATEMTENATQPEEETTVESSSEETEKKNEWQGPVLTARLGTVQGPSGKETYYNLPMGGVVKIMRDLGYGEEEYPYWVRDDGCKMLGPYIMVAANLELRPRGTILDSSLGQAIVADTGEFAKKDKNQIDIAVDW